ncbi:zinc finger protein 544 [Drosophila gunungcola]|uniref:zinc finger protein 544 n=1 Tax=Drosophila gunungcola TaxID=103775 RepID=UPI0022E37AC5|nr:zinc finger protein 544 [Drosophila gunungcola]
MEISIKWSMCRTCTAKKGFMLQSLFKSEAYKQLLLYAGIVVKPDDGLPDQICSDCVDRLEDVDRFLSECKRSDEHLRSLVRQTMSSAASFQTIENKDPPVSQRKRARKQNISERLMEEKPLVIKTDESQCQESRETKAKSVESVPTKKPPSPEEAGHFVYVLNVNTDKEKPTILEDYIISGSVKDSINDNDLESSSQDGTVVIDSMQETSEESQKSEPAPEYDIDLGVVCVPDKYRCRICHNSYAYLSQLKVHMTFHRNEKGYECEVCRKTFRAACNLKTHMRTHTGEKPYKCSYCTRRFADCSTHRKHERMHTNERPYACNICGKTFSLSTSRKAHYLLHSADKPHKCLTCDKAFRLKHQLTAHEKTNAHYLGVTAVIEDSDLMT